MMMKDKDLEWTFRQRETIVKDQWIDFRKDTYMMPDHSIRGPFYTFSKKNYAVVCATDEEGRLICVRQYRQGIRHVTTEFPAGGIEDDTPGRPEEKTALSAARRELREETGYTSEQWHYLGMMPSNPTVADNYACIFFAENCRKTENISPDDTEFLKTVLYTRDDFEKLIRNGGFEQPVHLLAWYMVRGTGK